MPPKPKVTEDMIIDAALAVVEEAGLEAVNARMVAARLGCSTQPVMYRFATMEDLKRAAYARLNDLHTAFLLDVSAAEDPLLGIGLNYIRFAVAHPQWFRFLLQSGYARETNLPDMIDSPDVAPIIAAMQEGIGLDADGTRQVFLTLALVVHGYASIIANNGLPFDEGAVAAHLEQVFYGAVAAASEATAGEENAGEAAASSIEEQE